MPTGNVSRRKLLMTVGAATVLPLVRAASAGAGPAQDSEGSVHRIVTANILLDLPEQRGTPLDWAAHRRAVCLQVIQSRNPHILCLQEVSRGQHIDFLGAFAGFASFGFADPYIDTNPRRFGGIKNVIMYSTERYEQTSAGTYWLSGTPHIAGSKLPGANLPRHVTWLRLRVRATGREFRVLNTHWELLPTIRRQEAAMIVEEAGAYRPDFPQLLAGDLNSDCESSEHKVLLDAGWKDTHEAVHGPDPGDDMQHGKGAERPRKSRIDFILFRGSVRPAGAEIIHDTVNGLPPSDHPFVSADVELLG